MNPPALTGAPIEGKTRVGHLIFRDADDATDGCWALVYEDDQGIDPDRPCLSLYVDDADLATFMADGVLGATEGWWD